MEIKTYIFPLITERELNLPFIVTGIGCHHKQEHVKRTHGYPYFQWLQCYSGRGKFIIGNKTYELTENQGMLLFPDEAHEYYAMDDKWELDYIAFAGTQIREFFTSNAGIKNSSLFYVSHPEVLLTKIRQILTVEQSTSLVKGLDCSHLAYAILIEILKTASSNVDSSLDYQFNRLRPIFNLIEANYNKTITLTQLAEIIGVTPQYFCVLFKKATGLRLLEYVNFIRIKNAKQTIIRDQHLHINEIANICGYDDVSYFCAQFKKIEGITPNEFRKLYLSHS